MSDETRTPELDHVLDLIVEEALDKARSMLPGRVTAYDADRQCVSVQPLIRAGHVDADGDRELETLPEVHDVPVWFLGAQTNGRITVPVAKGDTGMIVFASMSIARWKLKGGLVDPGDDRRHDINDCFFMPGGHDFAHVPSSAPTDAIVTHGETRIGGPLGTEKMIRGETYRGAEDTLLTALSVFVAAVSTFAATCTGPTPPQLAALTGAATTFEGAVTAFQSAAATYLAQNGRVL